MAETKVVLFSYFRSSCAWRLRIALASKGIEYEYRAINLLKREQLSDEFVKISPMGQVPALLVHGQTITQSVAMFEYIEDAYPDKPLLPKDIIKRAKVREVSQIIATGIQPLQNMSVLQKLPEDDRKKWAHDAIAKGFTALETLLKSTSGQYCVGDDVTWADCCIVPQIFNAKRYGVDMTLFPIITRIGDALNLLPAFEESHPLKQPDCPEDLKS